MEHIIPLYFLGNILFLYYYSFFFLSVIFTRLDMRYCSFLWIIQCFFTSSSDLWWKQAEVNRNKQSNNNVAFWGTCVVTGCDGCLFVITTNMIMRKTLAYPWCALKQKGTSLLVCLHIYISIFFGSFWITLLFTLNVFECMLWFSFQ